MKKKILYSVLCVVFSIGAFGMSYALSSYLSSFNALYGTAGTAIASCALCHPAGGGNNASNLNNFGNDYANNGYNYAAIANLDSDGDGFTNIEEITARTFPGDATSHPTAADTAAPVVTGFVIPATSSALSVVITTFTATDVVGVTGYLVTETSATPAASATGWSAARPASYAFSTAGAKTLYAWAKDAAGNISAPISRTVTITLPDTTAPVVSGFTIPASASSLNVAITTFTATDSVGVTGYLITETSATPAASATGWAAARPASYTFSSAGDKTLYAWAKDGAGNISAPVSRTITITLPDTTPPVITSFVIPAASNTLVVPITTFSATDSTGITGYLVTETSAIPAASAIGWSGAAPTGYTFGTGGSKTLYAWAKDGAGNISTPVSRTVTITLPDTTAPIVTGFVIPSTSTTLTVPITTFTATDSAGVTGYLVTTSSAIPASNATGWSGTALVSYSFTTAGAKSLYAWAKDAAGNVSAPLSAVTTITLPDTAAPVVTGFVIPSSSNTLTIPVTTLIATDNIGVTGYLIKETSAIPAASAAGWSSAVPTSYTFGSAGSKALYAWAKDGAGNVSAPLSAMIAVSLPDVTAPFITGFVIPSSSSSLIVPITTLTATDDVGITGYLVTEISTIPLVSASGWNSVAPTSYTFAAAGNKTLYAWVKDAAGHISASAVAMTTIASSDATPPVVTGFAIPSGSALLTVPITAFTATDNVGVTGYAVTETSTAPAASAAAWSAGPGTSYTFSSAGTKTLYAWARDAAGNVSAAVSSTVAVTVSDQTPPTITSFIIPSRSSSLTVQVTSFRVTDNVGVKGYMLTQSNATPAASAQGWKSTPPASYTFSSRGTKYLYAWAKDAAGNVSRGVWRQVIVSYSGSVPSGGSDDDDERDDD